MTDTIKIMAISGSLRDGSYNTATLHAAKELAGNHSDVDIVTLEDVPSYNYDVEQKGWPGAVAALRNKASDADGVLIATPEYNYSVPGVLKNAIDWLSRGEEPPLAGKPVAIVGASSSGIGTARAQAHLRDIVFYNSMPLLSNQEVLIARAADSFDENGRLTDEKAREKISALMRDLAALVRMHKQAA